MNITSFTKWLNKSRKLNIDGSYYSNIDLWKQWWMGYVPAVHKIKEGAADGSIITRDMASLHMAKQSCEDWAALLLNDKTTATIKDKASSTWLMGEKESQQTGGILRKINFWPNANKLVELMMRSGTGAFVMSVEGMVVEGGTAVLSPEAHICMDYVPAECILPLTVQHGAIQDVAFASEVTIDGRSCIYLQTHKLVGDAYQITNEYFTGDKEDSDAAAYTPAPLPQGVVASFSTNSAVPWFAIMTPNVVKNIRGGPGLGMSVFSEAIDAARHIDLAFDNYNQDIYLGGKKVFYSAHISKTLIGKDGVEHRISPDAMRKQQFFELPESDGADPDKPAEWHEYNPDLRVDANSKAVQDALDYFSFKIGLGTHHYQFNAGTIATAAQYNGDRQDMVQHANKHQINIEAALVQIFRAILYAGKAILGAPVDPGTEISINWDDSYITDAESRLAQEKDDALNGIIPKYKYIMDRYNISEADAKALAVEAQQDSGGSEPLTFGGGGDA